MAESTVVEGPTLDSRPALPLIAGGVVVAGAAVLALLIGPPSILLGGCVLAGFGITYVSGIALTLEERLAFGTVLGAMAVAVVGFVISMIVRDVTLATVLVATAVALCTGGAALFLRRDELAADWAGAGARWSAPLSSSSHPWPLFAIFLACGAWTVHFLHQAWTYRSDGLYAGYVNIWGDWAAHLTFTGSFAYGHNFPPQYPIDTGHRMGYPFMIDFLAADLVPLGTSLTESITATSGMLGLAFPAVLYLAALRFTAGRGASVIAVFVFLLSGGLGFVYLLSCLQRGGVAVVCAAPARV